MTDRLERLIEALARAPADRALDAIETEVSRGVARWRAQARLRASLTPIRFAAIGAALLMGVTAGGIASAMAPRGAGVFSAGADLAPSTLLDGR